MSHQQLMRTEPKKKPAQCCAGFKSITKGGGNGGDRSHYACNFAAAQHFYSFSFLKNNAR
jgi:hypothetical protein